MLTFKNLIHHFVVPIVSPAGSVTSGENDIQSFSNTLGFTTLPKGEGWKSYPSLLFILFIG